MYSIRRVAHRFSGGGSRILHHLSWQRPERMVALRAQFSLCNTAGGAYRAGDEDHLFIVIAIVSPERLPMPTA